MEQLPENETRRIRAGRSLTGPQSNSAGASQLLCPLIASCDGRVPEVLPCRDSLLPRWHVPWVPVLAAFTLAQSPVSFPVTSEARYFPRNIRASQLLEPKTR